MDEFALKQYLNQGIEHILTDALRASIRNPRQSLFLARFLPAARAASLRREAAGLRAASEEKEPAARAASLRREAAGLRAASIPPFLIASITSRCNLHCEGCYARAGSSCFDGENVRLLGASEWERIFREADDLGISFVLLAGGEPFLRMDVLEKAAGLPNIVFPIFTNGTVIGDKELEFLDRRRNLIPILSLEGGRAETDLRRGEGVYSQILGVMGSLTKRGVFFGISVTVTGENRAEVTDDAFVREMFSLGARLLLFVEYVPADPAARSTALEPEERERLMCRVAEIRRDFRELMILAFPGDELASGGCLAAGRGFFHINPHGGAEPCPFSPFSDTSLRDVSLANALQSPLFRSIRNAGFLAGDHAGGCVLFGHEEEVKGYLGKEKDGCEDKG